MPVSDCAPIDAGLATMPAESLSSPASPVHAPLCPACGEPNGCVVSAAGAFDVACWCMDASLRPSVLAAVGVAGQDVACVCRRCAQAACNG
jgi:hypothetical protein